MAISSIVYIWPEFLSRFLVTVTDNAVQEFLQSVTVCTTQILSLTAAQLSELAHDNTAAHTYSRVGLDLIKEILSLEDLVRVPYECYSTDSDTEGVQEELSGHFCTQHSH